MFGLSKSKSKNPEEQLKICQQKHDWAGLARAYYDMGVAAMDGKDLYQAVLWLHRADTIFSADDRVYKKVGEKLVDDCSDRIGTLEDGTLVYNDIYEEITGKAEEMEDIQIRLWDLLTIARLVKLGDRLGVSRQTVSSIENGKYNPSLELAFTISDFFGLSIEEIFIHERSGSDEKK